ncbi:MAG: alkaline phosphatase family protein [Pseudoflavonifractor sp.]|nr:alkaline phosphatase family protein [Alloprevotella sp.]MCM1116279.1 alkaline phosphatase family protein [Pseudoflavonifractor sp.]
MHLPVKPSPSSAISKVGAVRILCTIVAATVLLAAPARVEASMPASGQAPERPSLVIGILVEGLNEDMLKVLDSQLSPGGFKRLMSEGAVAEQIDYGTELDPVAATALLYTGAPPSVNGIPAAYVYQPSRHRSRPVLSDSAQMGNFTDATLSPAAIKVSTIADEVRIDGNGPTHVYALAADPSLAIIMAGHAANGGYWIDDINGRWASTTYYRDLPQSISLRNYNTPLDKRLDSIAWTPLFGTLQGYPDLTPAMKQAGFRYTFPRNTRDRYRSFKASPRGNEEVTDMASELIHYQMLGQHQGTDMLSLSYTLAPYPYSGEATPRAETLDAYLRLDRDLQKLMRTIDKSPGSDHTLIFVAGLPAPASSRPDDERWRLPSGEFSSRKARSLLNMYLMALHGTGEWVIGYHDRHFYLNHALIKENKLDIPAVRAEAAQFLSRMSGVSGAYTIDDIMAGRVGTDPEAIRRNTSVSYTGDIILDINPGWTAVDDLEGGPSHFSRLGTAASPFIIWGSGVAPARITEPIDARRIAPSVTRLLRIRSPNAAALGPVRF